MPHLLLTSHGEFCNVPIVVGTGKLIANRCTYQRLCHQKKRHGYPSHVRKWCNKNWDATRSITPSTSDPIQIQKDYNENQQTSTPPEDLKDVEIVTKSVPEMDQRTAEILCVVFVCGFDDPKIT